MFHISILMQLFLSAAVASWSVLYSPKSICVFESSSVEFSCSFDFLYGRIVTSKWFKPRAYEKQDGSQEGRFVYHSNPAEIHKRYKNRTTFANQDRNCSLTLHNVSKKDIGRYFFRFETQYQFGKFTGSNGIDLNVAGLPFGVTVNTQKTNGEVYEGDSVTLRCSTENCTPRKGPFVWFKNGLLLPQATEQEFTFSSVSHQDFGNYSCGLNNSDRTATNETLLDVRYSPKNVQITIFPSGEIEEGDSVTLKCISNANPALTNYTWFKISDTNVSYVGYDSKRILRTVDQKDAGRYFCVAMNDMGSQSSTVIELKVKVHDRPHFLLFTMAALLFGIALTLIIFGLMKRSSRKLHTAP
ncbi:B-cell receptor CD22 isoform X2 [Triplophysa rosa]|uniref:B-cell receptor CD22 isoform X2 n=1 Tax=Triplophysa rosa TaxID=992332 RepID=UPI002545F595|nr:B-cell receptor CD22 isoform X2 [Triplophysa rosa]